MEESRAGGLGAIALSKGEAFAGGGNRPIELSDPETVWYVVRGAVDVFVARRAGNEAASDFRQVLRVGPGRLLFGIAPDEDGAPQVCVAKGLPGAELRRVPRAAFAEEPGTAGPLAGQIDAWIIDFAAAIARAMSPRPRPGRFLTAGEDVDAAGEGVLATRRGVVWVASPAEDAAFLGVGEPTAGSPGFMPLTPDAWITLFRPGRLVTASSEALDARGLLVPALAEFHRLALAAHALNQRLTLVDTANLQRAQALHRRRREAGARRGLFNVLDAGRAPAADEESALPAALERIGRHEGIRFRFPARRPDTEGGGPDLAETRRVSGVRARRVRLAADDRWWIGDSGALLAFRRGSGSPVALIPGATGRYRLFDPETGRSERVDARLARGLDAEAYFFYRPLPPRPIRSLALARFAFRGLRGALARFALVGTLAGLVMLTPPVLLGALADRVIPSGSVRQLLQVSLSLVLLAVLAALLQTFQGTALMRLEALPSARVGAALWDRLLGLPRRFFRRFSAGDLALRVMAFQQLRDQFSGVVANALLSVIFLLPTFVLLFLYDTRIGWLGLGLGLLSLGVTLAVGILQLPLHRRRFAISRRLAGKLLQLLSGVGKLRSTGSEGIGFAVWAAGYREQKEIELRLAGRDRHLIAFLSAAPVLAAAAVFGAAAGRGDAALPAGDFLAVYAAFMVFYAAVAGLGGSFSAVAAILPAFQQAAPILEAAPETGAGGEPPPPLSGDVRLDRVSFRYAEDGPLVLRDVSIHARAGEFVAVVGESGAGKSTLLRLAVGLETPASGAVYYDGRDLGRLDARAVRARVGTVTQDASLQPGTVLENIIGLSAELTEENAWRAARLAAVEEDIAALPMRMQTVTGDGSPLFSGGQIQRIMLAAALVRDPVVLFLDEATNWLDNRSQAQVMEHVAGLAVTRIVSAHRLSTIRMADRIHVLQDGRVVQTGTFDDLQETEGPFRELVRRQMI